MIARTTTAISGPDIHAISFLSDGNLISNHKPIKMLVTHGLRLTLLITKGCWLVSKPIESVKNNQLISKSRVLVRQSVTAATDSKAKKMLSSKGVFQWTTLGGIIAFWIFLLVSQRLFVSLVSC
jgi:hypothetical protein